MSEKRGRGQPKFEPTPDQRSQVKLMKAMGRSRAPDSTWGSGYIAAALTIG
jgi:hypothetical protein